MSRRTGGIIGPKPTWTTTATSGIFSLGDVAGLKAAAQWPRGPIAPTNLAGTGTDGQVALTWTAPATTHGTITDYIVEYTPNAGSPTVVATGSTAASYTLTGLTNGTEYTIRVAAVNHTRGDFSSSVTATPSSTPPDPNWSSVRALMRFDGADGGTVFTNTASTSLTFTTSAGAVTAASAAKFGAGGLSGGWLRMSDGGGSGSVFNVGYNWTIEAWVRFNTISGSPVGNGLFALWDDGQGALATLRLLSSGVVLCLGADASGQPLSAGTWHHVAWVRQVNEIKTFVDGQLALTNDLGGAAPFLQTSIFLLRDPVNNSGPADAAMDEFRFTPGVSRYTANFTPPTAAFPNA
jgi:hypothetical protein